DLTTVQGRDGLVGVARRAHLDEAEAPRAPRVAIGHDVDRVARADLGEQRLEVLVGGRKGQVPDENLLAHDISSPLREAVSYVAVAWARSQIVRTKERPRVTHRTRGRSRLSRDRPLAQCLRQER